MATAISIALGLGLGLMIAIALLNVLHGLHIDEASLKFFKEMGKHT